MDYVTAIEYYSAINVLEGQEALIEMNIADYPHLKKDGRSKLYKEIRKEAYPSSMQKRMSFEDFARKMTDG